MIEYEAFAENVAAQLEYVATLPPEHRYPILLRQLQDGSWRKEPVRWSWSFRQNVGRSGFESESAEIRRTLFRCLMDLPIAAEAHAILPPLFEQDRFRGGASDLGELVDWLSHVLRPEDASLVADLVERAAPAWRPERHERVAAWTLVRPLVEWLLGNGAAELRSRRRVDLLIELAIGCAAAGCEPGVRLAALRYLLVNEAGIPWARITSAEVELTLAFLGAIESILQEENGESFVGDLLRSDRDGHAERLFIDVLGNVGPRGAHPRFRRAIQRALFRGDIAGKLSNALSRVWSVALTHEFPGEDVAVFATSEPLEVALQSRQAQGGLLSHPYLPLGPSTPESQERWGRALGREAIRIWGLRGIANHPNPGAPRLDRVLGAEGPPSFEKGLLDEVQRALEAGDGTAPSLALRILRAHPGDHRVLGAALRALPSYAENRADFAPSPAVIQDIRERLDAFLHAPWFEREGGVDVAQLLRGARHVDLASLENEDKVAIVDGWLRIDGDSMLAAIDPSMTSEEQVAQGLIYVVHELVHVQQGIAAKSKVTDLRATGAESTLLHLDLSADHATALIVSKSSPRWDLVWLKDLQGRSLRRFPSGPLHTSAARARKHQRHVALRLDHWLRRLRPEMLPDLGNGYAFADFGPVGGHLLVLTNGPPTKLLGSAPLDTNEAQLLERGPSGAASDTKSGAPAAAGEPPTVDGLLRRVIMSLER